MGVIVPPAIPSKNPPYIWPNTAPAGTSPAVGDSCSTTRMSTEMSIIVLAGITRLNKTSVSCEPDILHHLLDADGGGLVDILNGFTPIVVSEITVEGEFSPIHSNCAVVRGLGPDAPVPITGLDQIFTLFNRIPSITRMVLVADVATINKLRRFFLVMLIALVDPEHENRKR